MAEFSYESDIAPMRGDNFYTGPVPTGVEYQRFLTTKSMIEKNLQNERNQLATQRAQLEFEAAKRDMERSAEMSRFEREGLLAVPALTQQLTSILDDPTKDDATKAADAAKLKLQNANLISNSKTVGNVFSAFDEEIKTRKIESSQINSLAVTLAQAGRPDAVRKVFAGKNIPLSDEIIIAADEIALGKKQEREDAARLKGLEETGKTSRSETRTKLDALNKQRETLLGMKPQTGTLPSEGDGQFGATSDGKVPTFSAIQKRTLESMYKRLNPSARKKDLSKMSDEKFLEIYSDTLDGTLSEIDELSGGIAPESNISKKSQ